MCRCLIAIVKNEYNYLILKIKMTLPTHIRTFDDRIVATKILPQNHIRVSVASGVILNNTLSVLGWRTEDDYKGHRFGLMALYELVGYATTLHNISYVELDDMTGVYPPVNIYYRLGFKINGVDEDEKWVAWHVDSQICGPERKIRSSTLRRRLYRMIHNN